MAGRKSSNGRRTQAERRAQSELKLLRAALRLFSVKGFTGTTMAEVGAAAGYSRGLVTQRFGSKLGLAHAVIELVAKGFEEDIVPELEAMPDRLALHGYVDRYIELLESGSPTYPALLALQAESITVLHELRPALANLNRSVRAYLIGRLEAAQAGGEIVPDADLRSITTATRAMLRGAASKWLIDPDGIDVQAAGEAAKAMLSSSLFAVEAWASPHPA